MRKWLSYMSIAGLFTVMVASPAAASDLEGGCPGNGWQLVTVQSMLDLGHTITEDRVDTNGVFDGWYCIHVLPAAAWAVAGGYPEGAPEFLKLFMDNELPFQATN